MPSIVTNLETLEVSLVGEAKYAELALSERSALDLARMYRAAKVGSWPECYSLAWNFVKRHDWCALSSPAFLRRDWPGAMLAAMPGASYPILKTRMAVSYRPEGR